jgi:hypothetical protein
MAYCLLLRAPGCLKDGPYLCQPVKNKKITPYCIQGNYILKQTDTFYLKGPGYPKDIL